MATFEFYMSDEDLDKVFAIKEIQGKTDLTANEFAAELLHSELYRLFPAKPLYDEGGNLINKDKYRGK